MPSPPAQQSGGVASSDAPATGRVDPSVALVDTSLGPSAATGLTSAEARRRLEVDGPNTLPSPPRTPAWRMLANELTHYFALLFWVAAGLAFVARMPQLGVAIIIVVVLNAGFAFVQEERAEHAVERVRDLLPQRTTVVRDGVAREVVADEVVVGDAVVLGEGDRLSADLRLDTVGALAVDTSTLTGESVPDHPLVGDVVSAGCCVVEGEGRGTVTAIGADTRLAGIAGLTVAGRVPHTPLRRELDRLSVLMAGVAIAVGVTFLAVAVLIGMKPSDGFLFAVGVTVAVLPASLLPTVTLSLAIGAQRMAERRALVRHLEAVETLGSTTFICTDKTGTLTRNQMEVVAVWTPAGSVTIDGLGYEPTARIESTSAATSAATHRLAVVAARCSNGAVVEEAGDWVPRGDPMEAALHALAARMGVDELVEASRAPETIRFPFDARRRRMSVVTTDDVLVKGAPDAVLPQCEPIHGAEEVVLDLASQGLRVIAVAARPSGGTVPASADEAERDLTLLGFVALEDPPREHAASALGQCRRAGISVAMVTGDHPETALAIAREVGLARAGDSTVLLGSELPVDDDELGEIIDHDGLVIARVVPEDKLRIANALGARGEVVAMTGDGVNDGPALQAAAIGVAMGRSGTDVAREAADLVLLDDDFSTIVEAVEHGRSTFANIRRFLTYHLTDNVAELTPFFIWALSGGRVPLALGVLQVLALDVVTDILPAIALGAEPPGPHVLDRPPIRRHLLDRRTSTRAFALLGPVEAVLAMGAFFATFLGQGWRPGEPFPTGAALWAASGAAFAAVVIGQTGNVLACRSTVLPAWRVDVRRNRLLPWAIALQLSLLALLLLTPIASVLHQARPSLAGAAVAVAALPAVILADAAEKRVVRRSLFGVPAMSTRAGP